TGRRCIDLHQCELLGRPRGSPAGLEILQFAGSTMCATSPTVGGRGSRESACELGWRHKITWNHRVIAPPPCRRPHRCARHYGGVRRSVRPAGSGPGGCVTRRHPSESRHRQGTREHARIKTVEIVRELAPLLRDASIAYKKVDSLMRGAWAAELAACWKLGAWRRCVVAPAFPYQGRRTRGGRQFARMPDGSWQTASGDLAAALRAEGIAAVRADPTQK